MSNSKKQTDPKSSPDAAPEAEAKDTRPRRPLKVGGPEYPVVRSFYHPVQNIVIDVVEVTKKVMNADKTISTAVFHRSARCTDERIQKKYCRPEEVTDIPVLLDVEEDDFDV